MAKEKIKELEPHIVLYRDPNTGIAWVENGKAGCGHSCHPNIDRTGSVRGMTQLGYWAKDAKCIRSHGYIYNTSIIWTTDKYDEIAKEHCQCESCKARREQ